MKIYPIAIIGGGSAGTMGTLRSVLNNDETLFFPGSPKHKKRSRAFWVSKIENMPGHLGYPKGIENPNNESLQWLNKSALGHRLHWMKNRGIKTIVRGDTFFTLTDNNGESYHCEFVVLATGIMDIQPIIGKDIRPILPYANVQLADYCIRCDGHHTYKKHTGIIGHTTGAAWVAIMLYERYELSSMTLLTNGEALQIDHETKDLFDRYGIKVKEEKIVDILGDHKAKLLEGFRLDTGEIVSLEICFVSLGMMVYNQLAKDLGALIDERGFVVTDKKGESSVKNLYAIGDLQAGLKKQVYTAWDSAVDALDHINGLLRGRRRLKA